MFVRRKVNKSGTISVQVISKNRGNYKVERSFGAVRAESDIVCLEEQARQYVRAQEGFVDSLFIDRDETSFKNFVSSITNDSIRVIGPELIFGQLYDRIGFSQVKSDMFRHLVISRLFSPGSKLKTIDYLERYQGISYSKDTVYRFLDRLCSKDKAKSETDIKKQVEQISFHHTKKVLKGKISVVFYDMTTLYFEASDEDDLRKTGFSKDGKHQCPQIFLGLLVAAEGNPIGYEIFEGNIFEGHTFIPVLQKMAKRFSLGKPVVIADSGLLSDNNIASLEEDGYKYILGARPKNVKDEIKQKILSLLPKDGQTASISLEGKKRLILSMSNRRANKDAKNRERGLMRLQKRLNSGKLTKANINNRGYNKYLKLEGKIRISINMDKYNADAAWDGLKVYKTNTRLSAKKIIENYGNLWYIERAFRMNKTDLRIRPIYHHVRNRIEGHICICFTAYSILLETERMLKKYLPETTLKRAQELVKTMYQLTYRIPSSRETHTQVLGMSDEQHKLYETVCRWCR